MLPLFVTPSSVPSPSTARASNRLVLGRLRSRAPLSFLTKGLFAGQGGLGFPVRTSFDNLGRFAFRVPFLVLRILMPFAGSNIQLVMQGRLWRIQLGGDRFGILNRGIRERHSEIRYLAVVDLLVLGGITRACGKMH